MPPPRRRRPSTASPPRSALEGTFPIERVSELARVESFRKEIHRPIYHVHKWWASRLGSVFRAILLAANLPPGEDLFEHFYRPHAFGDRLVLDPFMGSGTTVGEALKLGYRVVGGDINPVSWFQVKTVLEACPATDLEAAYRRLEASVAPRIRPWYESSYAGAKAQILYAFWCQIAACPACGSNTRLLRRWVFASHAYPTRSPRAQALCPQCGGIVQVLYTDHRALCHVCKHEFDPQSGPAQRDTFVCTQCERQHRILECVRNSAGPPRHELIALKLLLLDGGCVYKQPDRADFLRVERATHALHRRRLPLPTARIPPGHNTDQARQYNYRWWRQMFNDRQLLTLGELLRGILREPDPIAQEALLLLFSGVLEFNNLFCTFKGEGTGAVRHLFAHHILRPPRAPLEANPWGTPKSSGSFSTLFRRRLVAAQRYCAEPFELAIRDGAGRRSSVRVKGCNRPLRPRLAADFDALRRHSGDALILHGDSSRLPLPTHSIDLVVTDPPYFDNVHYSELADFFHAWLRGPLARRYRAFRPLTTRSRREVQAGAEADFGQRLGAVLRECARVVKPDGQVVFTFHHSRGEAWCQVSGALRRAALAVTAAHPVVAEMAGAAPKLRSREPIQLDLIVVCRPRRHGMGPAPTRNRNSSLLRRIESTRRHFEARGFTLTRGDLRVVVTGALLEAGADVAQADQLLARLVGAQP